MMRSTKTLALVGLGVLLGVSGLPMPATAGAAAKVEVCHIPPGNPGNFHTILVGENALPAHLAHGDPAGACGLVCETLCDDNDACTADACDDSDRCVHSAADCNDGNTCTADSCDPASGCVGTPLTGEACDVVDEDPCTTGDGTCDASGKCVPVRVPGCCNSAADCESDKSPCTEPPQCIGNVCKEEDVDCDTGNPCVMGFCDPFTGECEASDAICKQQPCHVTTCNPASGECIATRIEGCCLADEECGDGNACTTDVCQAETCSNENLHKQDPCTVWVSRDGECVTESIDCDDGLSCTDDQCDPELGCVNTLDLFCDEECATNSSCSDCCQQRGVDAETECSNTCGSSLECAKCVTISAFTCNLCLDSCGVVPPLFQCQ